MLAIKGGTIYTITNGIIKDGVILIEDKMIKAVGKDVDIPKNCEIYNAKGKIIMPGFIDAHTHLGNFNEATGPVGFDGNEMTNPVTPHVRAKDSIWPQDMAYEDARSGGVSCACVLPGSGNVIGGTGVVVKTYGDSIDDMVIKDDCGMKVAFGENPKGVYAEQKKTPSTRMGNAAVLREALTKAKTYLAKKKRGEEDPDNAPDTDLAMEALIPVIQKRIPLRAHAHRTDDILTAIRIAKEFDVKIYIEHCTEGHLIVDHLKKSKVPAIVGPSFGHRSKVELRELSFKTAGILDKAGIPVCLMTDHPVIPLRFLVLMCGIAVSEGMDEERALEAITIRPARLLGIDKIVGSIEVSKDADISVWDRHPFDARAKLECFWIDGKKVHPKAS